MITTFCYHLFVHITTKNYTKKKKKTAEKVSFRSCTKTSSLVSSFNYPVSFILFIFSVGIKFCFRHHIKLMSEAAKGQLHSILRLQVSKLS